MDSMLPQDGMDAQFGGVSSDPAMEEPMPEQNTDINFEADFDAGVESNEEEDPKKFIQQLTGKLSQSLRKYNENQPKPDAELSKYVAGMVLKQALEGLSQKDVSDIMDKVETDGEEEDLEQQVQMDVPQQEEPMPQPEQAPMNETTGSTVNAIKQGAPKQTTKMRKGGYNRKPFRTTI